MTTMYHVSSFRLETAKATFDVRASLFENLYAATKANRHASAALDKSAVGNDKEAWALYRQRVQHVQDVVFLYAKAAKEQDYERMEALVAPFVAAFQEYLDLLGQDFKARRENLAAFLPHVGTYRKGEYLTYDETGNIMQDEEGGNIFHVENRFSTTSDAAFRKQFERTVVDDGKNIKTRAEVRAERKARDEAQKAAKKAEAKQAKEAGKAKDATAKQAAKAKTAETK